MTANVRRSLSRPAVLGGLVALFVCAFVATAYWDWMWWEPYNALLPYLAEGVLLLLAIILAAIPRARPFALVPAVVGIGLVAGQVLGPARPELRHGDGIVTVSLSAPVSAVGSASATCATSDGGRELQVSGDPNLRIDIFPDNPAAPPDIDQREFISVYLTIGDRWRRSVRADETDFHLSVGRVEADFTESWMMAGPSSMLTVDWRARAGSARFADLVHEIRPNEAPGEFIDVAGTLEWTCTYGP
jgi:hypothetical protein